MPKQVQIKFQQVIINQFLKVLMSSLALYGSFPFVQMPSTRPVAVAKASGTITSTSKF